MKNKICVIIQARMGSTRLPGKVMKEICGKTILEHDIERIRCAKNIDKIIIATTDQPEDDVIIQEANRLGISTFRGSEHNVLSRYYQAACHYQATTIIRITSDCPLYDGSLLDNMISVYKRNAYDYYSNTIDRTFPRGLDTEIFSFNTLKYVHENAVQDYEKEHVTPYFYQNPNIFSVGHHVQSQDHSMYRWTLDTAEDFTFISCIFDALYENNPSFSTQDILDLLEKQPDFIKINQHIEQKNPFNVNPLKR